MLGPRSLLCIRRRVLECVATTVYTPISRPVSLGLVAAVRQCDAYDLYSSSLLIKEPRCADAASNSRTTGSINNIYPWTTHVPLSYFKT